MENLKEQLGEIKEQLFDAPTEVKSAFNDVVQYFSGKGNSKQWYVTAEIFTGNGKATDWEDTFIKIGTAAEAEKVHRAHLEEEGLRVRRIKAFPCTTVIDKRGKSRPDYDWKAVEKWESSTK